MKKALKRISDKITGIHDGIRGNVSGITGDVDGITGNVDECNVSGEERKSGVNINDLIC